MFQCDADSRCYSRREYRGGEFIWCVETFDDRGGTTYPDLTWEPKAAFTTVAERYRVA
ncbi:hypothetical protein [Nocardia heshunensis]